MGLPRIKGELLMLGITVSATTIANVLRRAGLGPAPRRIGPTWGEFRTEPDGIGQHPERRGHPLGLFAR